MRLYRVVYPRLRHQISVDGAQLLGRKLRQPEPRHQRVAFRTYLRRALLHVLLVLIKLVQKLLRGPPADPSVEIWADVCADDGRPGSAEFPPSRKALTEDRLAAVFLRVAVRAPTHGDQVFGI